MTVLALLGVGILVLAAAAGWTLPGGGRGSLAVAGVLAASLASLGLLAVLTGPVATAGGDVAATLLVALFVVAAAGGGPLTATVLTLAAGWPEGLAVVLALKGLGRYNELRADSADGTVADRGGVAERFLIGSFTSLLWAVACAGAFIGLAG